MPTDPLTIDGMKEEIDKADVAVTLAITDGNLKIMSTSPDAQAIIHVITVAQHALVSTVAEAMLNEQPLDG